MTQEHSAVAIARLEERVASVSRDVSDGRADTKISLSAIHSAVKELESRERERNGSLKDLVKWSSSHEEADRQMVARFTAAAEQAASQLKGLEINLAAVMNQRLVGEAVAEERRRWVRWLGKFIDSLPKFASGAVLAFGLYKYVASM